MTLKLYNIQNWESNSTYLMLLLWVHAVIFRDHRIICLILGLKNDNDAMSWDTVLTGTIQLSVGQEETNWLG